MTEYFGQKQSTVVTFEMKAYYSLTQAYWLTTHKTSCITLRSPTQTLLTHRNPSLVDTWPGERAGSDITFLSLRKHLHLSPRVGRVHPSVYRQPGLTNLTRRDVTRKRFYSFQPFLRVRKEKSMVNIELSLLYLSLPIFMGLAPVRRTNY